MHNFKELRIWKESMELAKQVYPLLKEFPKEEKYALGQQISRCVVSIPSNIAEGAGRSTRKDFKHFITISVGSSFELETQLILAGEFDYISKIKLAPILDKVTTVQRMMNKFRDTLE